MRHDFKYSQSHLSAVRQRPDGSVMGQQQYNMGYHRKHYHHDNDEHNNNNNYNRYNKDRYYGSHSNSDEARLNLQNGATENGAIVSALSVSHESEKQWEWLEDVLQKSKENRETVSKYIRLKPQFTSFFLGEWTWGTILMLRALSLLISMSPPVNKHDLFNVVFVLSFLRIFLLFHALPRESLTITFKE